MRWLKAALIDIKQTVEQGATFSDALRRHPKIFDALFVNLVHAGEVGGILDTILGRLAIYLEKADKLKRQIKGAMMYPLATLVVAGVVVAVLLLKVVPTFETMFAEFGSSLPAPTQFVIDMSNWMQENFLIIGIEAHVGNHRKKIVLILFITLLISKLKFVSLQFNSL